MGDDLKLAATRTRDAEDFGGLALESQDGLDRLATAVFERLRRISDSDAIHDPQGILFAVAADVERSTPSKLSVSSDAALQEQASRFLQECVNALEPECKEILLLHVNDGLTYKQIAARVGRSTDHVLRHLIRAYCTLRSKRSPPGKFTD